MASETAHSAVSDERSSEADRTGGDARPSARCANTGHGRAANAGGTNAGHGDTATDGGTTGDAIRAAH
jgi:hypothetical protein